MTGFGNHSGLMFCFMLVCITSFVLYFMFFAFCSFYSLSLERKFKEQSISKSQYDKYNKYIIKLFVNFASFFIFMLAVVLFFMLLFTVVVNAPVS